MLNTVNINIGDVFPLEKDLENFLKDHPETLEEGMLFLDQQHGSNSSTKRADLLCLDKEGQLVVVEVKIVTAPRDSVMQLLGYLHEVNKDRQALFQEYQSKKNTVIWSTNDLVGLSSPPSFPRKSVTRWSL